LHKPIDAKTAAAKQALDQAFSLHSGWNLWVEIGEELEAFLQKCFSECNGDIGEMQTWLERQSHIVFANLPLTIDPASLFQNVGGTDCWSELLSVLQCTVDMNCASCGCHNKGELVCGACKLYRYCSDDCQRVDWQKQHKASCKLLRPVSKNYHLVKPPNLLKSLKEAIQYVEGIIQWCFKLYMKAQYNEAIEAAVPLLSYATVQYGEEVHGVDFRSREGFYLQNAKIDIDLLNLNIVIGGAYACRDKEGDDQLAEPYLRNAKKLSARLRLELEQMKPMDNDYRFLIVVSVIMLNLALIQQLKKMGTPSSIESIRVCIIDAQTFLDNHKKMFKICCKGESAYLRLVVEICTCCLEVAAIAQNAVVVVLDAVRLIDCAGTFVLSELGGKSREYQACLQFRVLLLLCMPLTKQSYPELQELLSSAKSNLLLTKERHITSSMYVAEGELLLAKVYKYCCDFEQGNNPDHNQAAKGNTRSLAKQGTTHAEKAFAVFHPTSESPIRAQSCKTLLLALNQYLE
jgi:hypothetical protein